MLCQKGGLFCRCERVLLSSGLGYARAQQPSPRSPWQPRSTSHHVSGLVHCTGHPRDLVELISWLVPQLQLVRISTHRHPSRVSTTATTTSHAATAPRREAFTYQRVSSKVLASAGSRARLRNPRRPEELSTAPKTWKCRLLPPRPAGSGGGTGVLGRGCHLPPLRGLWSFLPATRLLRWWRDFAGRAGTSCQPPVFCRRHLAIVRAVCGCVRRVKAALPSRSLGGRESCSPQGTRFGNTLFCCSVY